MADRLTTPALLAVAQHAKNGTTSLYEVLRDLQLVREAVSGFAGKMLVSMAMTPILLPLAFLVHWALAVIILLFCLAMALISLAMMGTMGRQRRLAAGNAAAVFGMTVDTMRSGEAVLAMGMLPRLARRWLSASSARAEESWRAEEAVARVQFLHQLALGLFRGAVMFAVTGITLAGGHMSSTFGGAAVLIMQVVTPFATLGNTIETWGEASAAWARLRRLASNVTQAPLQGLAFPVTQGRLVAERLSFRFDTRSPPILRNIDLAVEPRQLIGILGGPGSGKTTLMRLLLGLHQPSAGGVFLDGHATSQWDRRDLARHIGYLPQQPQLGSGTVAEVIARLEEPDPELVMDAARRAGAHDLIAGLPLGYATPLGQGTKLSLGQQHRIAIARALYGRPKLLLLDELGGSLDAEGEADVAAMLGRLRREGGSAVFTTHRPALLRMADRVLAIRNATLVPAGSAMHPHSDRSLPERRLA
ncbi:ATP-binding cassette domain-containing protein [Belnapia sp. T18]|uniref:ATP-binding cassette domain-containing protein n=1 Tax=Belnapia arida TaxID=2804533 RepID=A0ABS1U7N9_9PROT|nr:ATP-binding cassette domain-containing protein [Belnapia arida]MBL6080550.1 ATP-binding cassette domain-containing protein [Belnapia arida]